MKREQVSEIFYQCIERMEQGESIESCLSSYPDQLEYLTPLLRAAAKSLDLEPAHSRLITKPGGSKRAEKVIETLKEETFSRGGGQEARFQHSRTRGSDPIRSSAEPERGWGGMWGGMRLAVRTAVLVLAVSVMGGVFTLTASANSLPGDPLYTLKRSLEDTRLTLTVNEESRTALEVRFQQRRVEEIQALLSQGLAAEVEFQGTIGERSREIWTISGLPVIVQPGTELRGRLEGGEIVRVEAVTLVDGRVVAEEISATAAVESMPENPEEPPAANPPLEEDALEDQEVPGDDRDDDDRDDDDRDDDRDDDDRDDDRDDDDRDDDDRDDEDRDDDDRDDDDRDDDDRDDDRDDDDRGDDDRDDDDRDDDDRDDDDRDDDDRDDDDRDDDDRDDDDRDDDEDRELPDEMDEQVPDFVEEKVPDFVEEKIPGNRKDKDK